MFMGDMSSKEIMAKALSEKEFIPEPIEDPEKLDGFTKIPMDKLTGLGAGFGNIAQEILKSLPSGDSGIYSVKVPKGTHLAKRKNGSGYIGGALSNATNQVSGQATLKKVYFDPAMLCTTAMMVSINKRLDSIEETQKEILDLMKKKEKSEVRGNITFLADVFNNYKYNWDSDLYKSSNHVKALDIRQAAEQKIELYRSIIKEKIGKKSFIKVDQTIRKQMEDLRNDFWEYKLAVYMLGFSSLVEVMLLENYEEDYLGAVIGKIENSLMDYMEMYSHCYNEIEDDSKKSVQAHLMKGVAKVGIATSKLVSKTPGIKNTNIDENLSEKSEKLYSNVDEKRSKKMQDFADSSSHSVKPFIECLESIQDVYNKTLVIAFDNDNVYVECA